MQIYGIFGCAIMDSLRIRFRIYMSYGFHSYLGFTPRRYLECSTTLVTFRRTLTDTRADSTEGTQVLFDINNENGCLIAELVTYK